MTAETGETPRPLAGLEQSASAKKGGKGIHSQGKAHQRGIVVSNGLETRRQAGDSTNSGFRQEPAMPSFPPVREWRNILYLTSLSQRATKIFVALLWVVFGYPYLCPSSTPVPAKQRPCPCNHRQQGFLHHAGIVPFAVGSTMMCGKPCVSTAIVKHLKNRNGVASPCRTTCTVCGDAPGYAFLSIQLYMPLIFLLTPVAFSHGCYNRCAADREWRKEATLRGAVRLQAHFPTGKEECKLCAAGIA